MHEIDLIPVDYRLWLQQRRLLRDYGALFAVLIAVVIAAGSALAHQASRAEKEVGVMQSNNAVTQQQQLLLQQLDDQYAEAQRRWSLLRGLRAGAAIEDIYMMIDKSLVPQELWVLDWTFRRAGVIVNGEKRGIETGYFIIVQDSSSGNSDNLQVETHMDIRGQASDHEALSRFVRALFEQEEIRDVNVRRTSQSEYVNRRVVDFEVTVILESTAQDS